MGGDPLRKTSLSAPCPALRCMENGMSQGYSAAFASKPAVDRFLISADSADEHVRFGFWFLARKPESESLRTAVIRDRIAFCTKSDNHCRCSTNPTVPDSTCKSLWNRGNAFHVLPSLRCRRTGRFCCLWQYPSCRKARRGSSRQDTCSRICMLNSIGF